MSNHPDKVSRFWISWCVTEDDYRPYRFPPNDRVLGWWRTGEYGSDPVTHILVALVAADSADEARAAIAADWLIDLFRFVVEQEAEWLPPSDRFPLEQWMRERLGLTMTGVRALCDVAKNRSDE